MLKKAIHVLPDSPYSNWYVQNCLANGIDVENKFFCFTKENAYIHSEFITVKSPKPDSCKEILDLLNKSNVQATLYINYLNYFNASIVNQITKPIVKIVWMLWSEDLYGLPTLKIKKYDPYSMDYINKSKAKLTLKQSLGRLKMIYIDGIDLNNKVKWADIYKAIKRINFVATFFPEEHRIVQKFLNSNIKWLPFAYISYTNGQDLTSIKEADKEFIILGNSADPSNNHFEVLRKISGWSINEKIVLPLSYGDVDYRRELLNDIAGLFESERLIVLEQFMERLPYYNFLSKAKAAIFPHNIQQAVGNIIALVYLGARVFLKKSNPVYKRFKEIGFVINNIEDELTQEIVQKKLNKQETITNKRLIEAYFSDKKILDYYTELLLV
jgi:dTDP-N-acetylfucosamine:lipid II N-acetylfucosaminyltransferase